MVSKKKLPDEGRSCTSSVRYQRPDALNVSSLMDPEVTLGTIPPSYSNNKNSHFMFPEAESVRVIVIVEALFLVIVK